MNIVKTEALLKTEAELEETRKEISLQISLADWSTQSIDPTLYDKEQTLEQIIAIWHQHLKEAEEEQDQ